MKCHDALVHDQLDPVLGMEVAIDGPDLDPENALEQHGAGCDDRDRQAELAERRRGFRSDPAAADDHGALGAGGGVADRLGILQGAQVVHAGQI